MRIDLCLLGDVVSNKLRRDRALNSGDRLEDTLATAAALIILELAYHFTKASSLPKDLVPVAYAVAMGVSGSGSLLFGRLFDRFGITLLIPLTLIAAAFAPLVFWGGFWLALIGAAVWGLGIGVHESIIPAVVAPMVSPERRASAYGLFTAGYGVFWFTGSAIMGALYDHAVTAAVIFCVATQLAAIPIFFIVRSHWRRLESTSTPSQANL